MTRKDLAKLLSKKTSLKAKEAENLIIAFGDVIGNALKENKKIVYSNFGTFYTVHYPSKIIYHPKLGKAKKMVMLPTDAVKWMPAPNIKQMVNSGIEVENATVHGRKNTKQKTTKQHILDKPEEDSKPPIGDDLINEEPVEVPIKIKSRVTEKPSVSNNDDSEIKLNILKRDIRKPAKSIFDDEKPVDIYEERMNDGSKVESTFSDAIRVHKPQTKGLWNRVFGKKDIDEISSKDIDTTEIPKKERASLREAGIFDINTPAIKPQPPREDKAPRSALDNSETLQNEKRSETPENQNKNFEYFDEANNDEQPTALNDTKEIPITPFQVENSVSYIDLTDVTVPKEILQKIPEKIARKYKIVPISEVDSKITVAMIDPDDIEAKEIVKRLVGEEMIVRLSSESDINRILDQYSGLETELKEAIETADEERTPESRLQTADLIESASDNAPAARIVTSLLRRAVRDKASDIHIEPSEKEVEVRYRIDGILKKKASLPKDIQLAVISRIKILSNMKIDEQRLPQDGRFSIDMDGRRIDFRISTMPVTYGEKVVMRVLDKASSILTIEQLGIEGSGLASFNEDIKKTHGMILVTGPTGSGKTTTLYALIDKFYSEGINIVTLEDPIEYRMPGINQSQVNAEINYTFASGLRSIVRQDPDIIMIGEIRDAETAEMAIHSALTGHVVLSTLHTNNAAGAAPRLIDMGVEPFLLTSSLNCVVGQRLARKICPDCKKEEVKISAEELKEVKAIIETMPENERKEIAAKPLKFYKGKGCKNCNDSGYKGRISFFEVLGITENIKDLILKKESTSKLQEEAVRNGMVTMIQDGIIKALKGTTTLEEVWRISKE